MLMPAHFKSVMDLVENTNGAFPDVLSKMFGVRIPSQDNHSTINIKHVDFLPAFYGSSAMFAQELIEISGADFDIDKVYMQIKDFYEKGGQFYEYGKQTTDNGKYSDYLRYVSEKVAQSGTTYAEALELFDKNQQAATIENSVTKAEKALVIKAGLSENGVKALQILGLPITKEQYLDYKKKFREPYEAPMNNAILDYKYALMGNTGVTETTNKNETPISYTSASLQILQDSLAELEEVLPGLLERSREDNIDINNIIGKIKAFTNNKGAAIGAIVLPNVYLSLLTEYGITINDKGPKISINGITYDDFGVTREQLANGTEGLRKQDIISSLITMVTDNAKERLVAKLGLNKHALGVVGNLTALGVPIKTSLLLINNPMIQDIYSQALNKKDKLDPGVNGILNGILASLVDKTKAAKTNDAKSTEFVKVNDNLLIDAFNNPEEVTDKEKIAILNLFSNAVKVKDFTSNMSAVAGLTNGLGKDIASVNEKAEQIDKLFAKDAIMDLNPIYKSKTWQSKYLEIFNQIKNDLLPVTFLSASENFQAILTKVLENVNSDAIEFTEETKAKISRDLLSYLTIKAYEQNKLNNDPQSVATLNNNLIYPGGGYESINDVIDRMRATEAGQNNFFLDNFAISERATDEKNQSGLNLVNANTFRSLNAGQKVDLQNSFAKLYGSLETKNDALSIINYIMVKDGLQVGYASLLEAVSPFTMDSYLSQIETANKALRTDDDANIKKVFGLTKAQLESDFVNNYLQSNINGPLLYTMSRNETGSLPKGVSIKENKITIKWEDMYSSSPKNFVRLKFEDLQTGFVTYKTYMSTTQDESTTKVYEEIETKGSNQQTPIGFMFGERPTYKKVRDSIKTKNTTTAQDRYVDSVNFGAEENYALSAAEMVQLEALNDESANIEANEFGVNINGNNIANISALEAMLNAEPKQPTQRSTSVKNFDKKNLFEVTPIQTADKKAKIKASIATQFIGFGEGITGSSTEAYKKQAGKLANTGNYSSNDIIFVSIPGKRGDAEVSKKEQDKTIKEAIKAVEAGATILTDNKGYTDASSYNTGEKRLYDNMKAKGYQYSEITVDNQVIGTWSKPFTQPSASVKREYTPENITSLKPNEVFVFGANTVGGHGGGTAGLAQRGISSSNYTALPTGTKGKWSEYGIVDKLMEGTEGKSFGIVTKAASINGTSLKIGSRRSVPLSRIEESINALVKTANENPNLKFLVTKFGTNMAGFSIQEMKSLLQNKNLTDNIILPEEFEVRSELLNSQPETTTTLLDSMSDLERELYEEFAAEMESDYSAIENFWDTNIQKNPQAKENLRLNNNVLSLEDLIDMYNKGIYTSQEEFIEQIKQCNL
jgi:hypothetical protein